MHRIIVTAPDGYSDYRLFKSTLQSYINSLAPETVELVTGVLDEADGLCARLCDECDYEHTRFFTYERRYGNDAVRQRDMKMIDYASCLNGVAFVFGHIKTPFTNICRQRGIKMIVV